jgi:ATP-dependent RNA helicase RhlE
VELFKDEKMSRTLVFTRTKRGADRVAQTLDEAGISALAIHGNKSQGQRERALASFRAGNARALVATDIAARGIDIDGVTHVVNFELPEVAEAYVHRIGRTARAGHEGNAISLCDGTERDLLRNIERLTRLRIFTIDRRGVNGPAPAPVVRKAAKVASPERPHHAPHNDPRRAPGARPNGQPHRPRQGQRNRPAFSARTAPAR